MPQERDEYEGSGLTEIFATVPLQLFGDRRLDDGFGGLGVTFASVAGECHRADQEGG